MAMATTAAGRAIPIRRAGVTATRPAGAAAACRRGCTRNITPTPIAAIRIGTAARRAITGIGIITGRPGATTATRSPIRRWQEPGCTAGPFVSGTVAAAACVAALSTISSAAQKRPMSLFNLTGALVCCQAAYPHMQRQGGGKIINIGSMMAIFGAAYAAAYSASKGAIVQLSKSLATAWAKDNIQVNAVLPGWFDTELTRDARHQVPGLNERILNRTPAGRWGMPDDLAGVAVFLSGPASDFVTGATIAVDGGFSAEF